VECNGFSVLLFFSTYSCKSSLSLIVDYGPSKHVFIAADPLHRFESAAQGLDASTLCMFSPQRQSLSRALIFHCLN